MRHVLFVSVVGSVLGGSAGCAALHGLDEYTTADTLPPDAAIAADGGAPQPVTESGTPEIGCRSNRDCTDRTTSSAAPADGDAGGPVVCVKATGACVTLVTPDCPRVVGDYADDDAILVGTLVSDAEPGALEQAAVLAAEEINAAGGGLPPTVADGRARPLVVVGCNAGGDVLRAARHLVEALHVPAIVGPASAEAVVDVTQQVSAKGGTAIMTPTSLASTIANLADGDLTWRAIPSDAQRAKLVIEQLEDLETVLRTTRSLTSVKLAIVHPTNTIGLSARDAIRGKLILNGRFIDDAANAASVSIDAYQAGDAASEHAIATKYAVTFKPDMVFITAAEQVANVIVPLEQALTAARVVERPYYVLTDASKTRGLLDAVASTELPPDIRRRIRGVGVKPEAGSVPVLDAFRAAFATRYGSPPSGPEAAASYDAMYAFAYAIAATSATPLSGASVAHGLRTLEVGGAANVGAAGVTPNLHDLSAGRSVSLRGTFGLMHWDASGDIKGGTVEVWCVGTLAGAPAFGSSGLTMDVQTQVVGGAFVQCQ